MNAHFAGCTLEVCSMRTRDGVRLDADVYRPARSSPGPWPVLLMRQPYGRRIASTVCYAHPSWYAARGYLVVIQDVRGRGSSEGTFDPFEADADDGAETIEWAATLPGANGRVGMYGLSYQGTNQLLAAARRPRALRALAPAMIGWNLREDWAHENGAFALAANIEWAVQLALAQAARAQDWESYRALRAAARSTPVHDDVPGRPEVLQRARRHTHYFDWLDQPAESDYWAKRSPHTFEDALVQAAVPALFIGGWYDTHLRGTVAAFDTLRARGLATARLIIGPWLHLPWNRRVGERDFGAEAISPIDALQLEWFDYWLKDVGHAPVHWPAMRLFDVGPSADREHAAWTELEAWPTRAATLRLTSSGRAALDDRDGRLVPAIAADEELDTVSDALVHDPWRPAPAVGGPWGQPAGPVDCTAFEQRADVLTYTTAPFTAPLRLVGAAELALDLDTDAQSFDIAAILAIVSEGGARSQYLCEGYGSFRADPTRSRLELSLRPICATLQVGQRLRLSISASRFPAFAINPGDGTRPTGAKAADARIITIVLRHGGLHESVLRLPVENGGT